MNTLLIEQREGTGVSGQKDERFKSYTILTLLLNDDYDAMAIKF